MESVPLMLSGGVIASLVGVVCAQMRTIAELKRAQEKVVTEEARVFDFLHGLGEALSGTAKAADLHALIVKGVQRILGANAGGLYLVDSSGNTMQSAFISKGCPPLMEFPIASVESLASDPDALHRHMRLRSIRRGEGVLAEVWEKGTAVVMHAADDRLDIARRLGVLNGSVAVVPLLYAKRVFGVLLMARGVGEELFGNSDLQVFHTLAEQSAFALCTADVFSEAAEKRHLDKDLQVAHEIQRILLPNKAPEVSGFDISGVNVPAKHVSGDYFDYFFVDPTHCGVAIADVSGKGVPASLIMATCRSVLRSKAPDEISASAVLRKVNAQLFPDIKEDMFISMAYAVLEKDSPNVVLCRAGHDAPLLYRAADQSVTQINPPGMVVGIDSGGVFDRMLRDFTIEMQPGDCLIFYTDGVTEALNAEGDEFGLDQTIRSIVQSAASGPAGIIERLTADLKEFVGTFPQHDDITLIVIRKQ
ncbi:MAG: GAF domain-containing SpoIIE family protein phosphatase [Verrucomicrobiota bacterium]